MKTVFIGGRVVHKVVYDGNPDVAAQAADDWAIECLGKIEKRLGRRLTMKELRSGLALPETEKMSEILAKKSEYESYFPKEVDPRTPLERARDTRKAELKRERIGDARLALLEESVAREKEKAEQKAEKAKRDSDPRRQAAISDASAHVFTTLYNPDATQADLRAALWRERLAKESKPEVYAIAVNEWRQTELQKRRERATPLQQMADDLKNELAELSRPWELPSTGVVEFIQPPTE